MFRNIQTCTVVLLLAISASGCMKHSFKVGNGGDVDADPAYSAWESHWFFGIIGESEVDVNEVCPSGDATVKDQQSFLNGLVAAFVGVVWTPTTVKVYCAEGGGASDEGAVETAADAIDEAAEEPGEAIEEELEG